MYHFWMGPKANHYVPRFYLEGFVDPRLERKGQKMLWVYEADREPRTSLPKNAAFENYFYVCKQEGRKAFSIEESLAQIESFTAPVLQRLGSGDFTLSAQERGEFAGFLALMFTRVPFFHDATDRMAATLADWQMKVLASRPGALEQVLKGYEEKTGEKLKADAGELREFLSRGEYTVEQKSRGYTIRTMFEMMGMLMPVIEDMKWTLLTSDGAEMFLTSDNPVALHDPAVRPPYGVGFASSRYAEFTFPINRHVCLLARWQGEEGRFGLSDAHVRTVNKRTIVRASRYVFAAEKSRAIKKLVDSIHEDVAKI